ncbi:MAG: hypothetical protein J6U25_00585, partial [Clostridia bacterium]|nr:hypothetical protein [Clostridia bacterium]
MKVKKNRIFLTVVLIIALFISAIPLALSKSVAFAGESKLGVVTENTIKEKLSSANWNYTRNVKHEETAGKGYIVFSASFTGNERIVSTAYAADLRSLGLNDCWYGSISLKISELNGEFYVLFGLGSPKDTVTSGNFSAISFYDNAGEIAVKVINKNANAAPVTVKDIAATFAYNTTLTFDLTVRANGKVYLSINSTNYLNYDNASDCRAVGYFGFAQTAGSGVKITYAGDGLFTSVYDRPENANVDEDFEDGFDASRIFVNNNESRQGYYKPEGMYCEDGVLKFCNITSYGFVSTCYEFSNFTMKFDIPHLQREFVFDDDDNVVTPASNYWFGISIGSPQKNASHYAITQAVFILFTPRYVNNEPVGLSCQLLDNYNDVYHASLSDEDNFWLVENAYDISDRERTVNMKVEMADGRLICKFKWGDEVESKYRTIIDYDLGYTPLGYVQIHGQGYTATSILQNDSLAGSNFWIDNLKIE